MDNKTKEILNKVVKEIKQKTTEDIVVDFNDSNKKLDILCSWGSMLVDQIAPLVKSKIFECYGPYSSGKSSLAISACANVVKSGGIAVYIDVECAFNAGFAETLGLDISSDNFILLQPESEEDALAAAIKFANSGIIALIVLDSTNALTPKAEFMEEGDDSEELSTQRVGLRAKILGTAVAQLVPISPL
jgi:recombination protein RecA